MAKSPASRKPPSRAKQPAASASGRKPKARPRRRSARPPRRSSGQELLDFIALVMLAIKEEIEDLRQSQTRTAQAFSDQLMELGKQVPGSPTMAAIVGLMQGDDLRNQRQQHVVNALRYVEDLIREHSGRDWAPRLTERATGWGEGLLASQNLEQVRAHFHHYLLEKPAGSGDGAKGNEAGSNSDVELF